MRANRRAQLVNFFLQLFKDVFHVSPVKANTLGIRVESTTTVDNQKIKLRSSKGNEGEDKTGTTATLVVLFGPLGFLKHGKNAKIKSGTQIKVYTDEEKKIQIKG